MGRASKGFYLAVFALLGTSSRGHARSSSPVSPVAESCAIDPKAIVSDACASFSTLDELNRNLRPSIQSLTRDTDFFSYYRLNLYDKVCPFWSDDSGMCGNIACAVNTIDNEEDVPPIWRAEELGKLEGPQAQHPNRKMQAERESKPLQGELGADVGESCVVEYDDECDERDYCVPEDEGANSKGDYVSLVDNPERFTGYSGPSAQQVWQAIYRENCFSKEETDIPSLTAFSPRQRKPPKGLSPPQAAASVGLRNIIRDHERAQLLASPQPKSSSSSPSQDSEGIPSPHNLEMLQPDDQCLEKRVFYRVISGMHASISTHLCYSHLNQTTGLWSPNTACYVSRLRGHPDRISNLYFNYALVLRAVAKARSAFKSYTFCSGDTAQDQITKHKVLSLADAIATGPNIYDESLMFTTENSASAGLKEDFRARFRNVSRTMDCVGCDKCRLWGKLQTAGYGTALKILFEFGDGVDGGGGGGNDGKEENPPLRRTELVALVNTLDKLSHSLSALAHFESMLKDDDSSSSSSPLSSSSASNPQTQAQEPEKESQSQSQSQSQKSEDPSFTDDLHRELAEVYRALRWVLRRWYHMPGNVLRLVKWEVRRAWTYYLGFEVGERTWVVRRPGREEL